MQRSLEQRLADLEDVQAIQALKWRYLRACDRKLPEEVRDCFLPDAVIDFEGFPLFQGRDAFVAVYRNLACRPNVVDMHHGQNPVVELTGPDSARGAFDCYFHQIDTEARRVTQLAVSYDDAFLRRNGRWWIGRSVSRRVSMLVQDLDAEGLARIAIAGRSDDGDAAPAPR